MKESDGGLLPLLATLLMLPTDVRAVGRRSNTGELVDEDCDMVRERTLPVLAASAGSDVGNDSCSVEILMGKRVSVDERLKWRGEVAAPGGGEPGEEDGGDVTGAAAAVAAVGEEDAIVVAFAVVVVVVAVGGEYWSERGGGGGR